MLDGHLIVKNSITPPEDTVKIENLCKY